jgi:FtsP/CotA-like multicopper oxidase with cupredoxin domain
MRQRQEKTMSPSKMDRRDFVRTIAVAGGSVAAAGLVSGCVTDAPHDHSMMTEPALAAGGGGAVTRYPLRVPSIVAPGGLTLQAAPAPISIVPGKTTPAWMYNGQLPGPTIVAQSGVEYTGVEFVNGLNQNSIIHWHGLLVDSPNDGHPREVVGPGGRYGYTLNVQQRAALDWYHPHPHMMTGEQVYRGLAGAFIVRDGVDTGVGGLGLPFGEFEVPLIIRDASFDSRGNFQFSNKASGFWGNTPLVNGTFSPYLEVKKAVYRFRVLNGCNARVLRLAVSPSGTFTLIGNDGGLLDQPYTLTEITAAPGERFDILLDFRGLATGTTVMLRDLDAKWDVLEFRVIASTVSGSLPTGSLSTITALSSPATTRRFTFDGMTRINGKVYDIDAIEFQVPFDTTERWTFITNGNGPHPVHVHGATFQVVSRTGGRGRRFDWERGWKDTVLVNDGETVDVLIRFTAHKGLYIMHCHQLAHEDAGMMANFEVV